MTKDGESPSDTTKTWLFYFTQGLNTPVLRYTVTVKGAYKGAYKGNRKDGNFSFLNSPIFSTFTDLPQVFVFL
jgi:hypothetical protein